MSALLDNPQTRCALSNSAVLEATADDVVRKVFPSVYCRQCDADIPLSATRTLSMHRTSGGVVAYFRCRAGHADFYVKRVIPTNRVSRATPRCDSGPWRHRGDREFAILDGLTTVL